jgi:hypothetical protein
LLASYRPCYLHIGLAGFIIILRQQGLYEARKAYIKAGISIRVQQFIYEKYKAYIKPKII